MLHAALGYVSSVVSDRVVLSGWVLEVSKLAVDVSYVI